MSGSAFLQRNEESESGNHTDQSPQETDFNGNLRNIILSEQTIIKNNNMKSVISIYITKQCICEKPFQVSTRFREIIYSTSPVIS